MTTYDVRVTDEAGNVLSEKKIYAGKPGIAAKSVVDMTQRARLLPRNWTKLNVQIWREK